MAQSIRAKIIMNHGFTLVELLIVVIILAILAGIVVPQFASSTDDAKSSAADSTLSNLRSSIDLYYQQHGSYPGSSTAVGTSCPGTPAGTPGTGDASDAANREDAFLSQMTYYTDVAGKACSTKDTTYKFGPYLKKRPLPSDPFTGNTSAIEVVTAGNLNMVANTTPTGGPGGYKYDSATGKIIINLLAEQAR